MFTTALAGAEQARLFDFPAAAEWQAVKDGVMGGVSEGRVRITAGRTLEFFGTLGLGRQQRSQTVTAVWFYQL